MISQINHLLMKLKRVPDYTASCGENEIGISISNSLICIREFLQVFSLGEAHAPRSLLHLQHFLPLLPLPKTRSNLQRNKYFTLNTQHKKWAK